MNRPAYKAIGLGAMCLSAGISLFCLLVGIGWILAWANVG